MTDSLESIVVDVFDRNDTIWKLKNGDLIEPVETHVQQAIDEAMRLLYDKKVGTRCDVAGLIVERTETGGTVYAYVGHRNYKEKK